METTTEEERISVGALIDDLKVREREREREDARRERKNETRRPRRMMRCACMNAACARWTRWTPWVGWCGTARCARGGWGRRCDAMTTRETTE